MDLLSQFSSFIGAHGLFEKKDRLLVAVSGGMDSSVLCALCARAGYDFAMAHCNFKLRKEESDRDEAFVKALAKQMNAPFFTKTFDTRAIADENKTGIEESARKLRYDWFALLMEESKTSDAPFKYVLTAHHADDNIETVLMNFFRGTGIKGMRGILPKQNSIVRPLLFAGKKDIEDFAAENNIQFVTDSSNADNIYTRNYFRNELIPSIEKVFPNAKQNMLNSIGRLNDAAEVYSESIAAVKQKLLERKGNEVHIPVRKLVKSKPLQTIIYEVIKDYGFYASQTGEAEKLLQAESGKYIVSATHRLLRNRDWLIISPRDNAEDGGLFLIEEGKDVTQFPGGRMEVKLLTQPPVSLATDNNTAFINAATVTYPLLLRKWRTGDYFYPLGMQKKKKLSRFFGDLKLSLVQKEKVWVLESDKKIIWVTGCRIDDRAKVTHPQQAVLRLRLFPDAP